MGESSSPVRVTIRPAGAFGLGGLALVALVAVVAALVLGPLSHRGAQPGGAPTSSASAGPSMDTLLYQLVPPTGQQVTTADLDETVAILRNRLDSIGVGPSTVTAMLPDQVKVVVPVTISAASGVAPIEELLGVTGKLEFVLLPPEIYGSVDAALGTSIKPIPADGDPIDPSLPAQFTGDQLDVSGVSSGRDAGTNAWVVYFAWNATTAEDFATWSAAHVNQYFAIVLDGKVISVPYIKDAIAGGKGQINSNFTAESAKELATILKGGRLPLPIHLVPVETVVPSAPSPSPS